MLSHSRDQASFCVYCLSTHALSEWGTKSRPGLNGKAVAVCQRGCLWSGCVLVAHCEAVAEIMERAAGKKLRICVLVYTVRQIRVIGTI